MITRKTEFMMIDGTGRVVSGPFGGELKWDPDDPIAVVVTFFGDGSGVPVPWTFALDVLADGLHSYKGTGVGDINVRSAGRYVLVELSAGCENCQRFHTQATMRCDRADVVKFYDEVLRQPEANVLPTQAVDRAIERILETTPWG